MNQRVPVSIGDDFPVRDLSLEQALGVAVQLHQEGRWDRATRAYRSILAVLPKQFDALHLLGVMELQQGRADAAEGLIRQALEQQPDQGDALCNLGNALRALDRFEDAEASFRRALDTQPDLAAAHNGLGALAQTDQRFEVAVRHYRQAVAADPRRPGSRANLAACLLQLGDLPAAEAEARKAVSLDPKSGPAHKALGIALAGLGQLEESDSTLARAMELDPTDPDAAYQRGAVLDDAGRWDEALAVHRRALELRPDFGPALSSALFLTRRLCAWSQLDGLQSRFLGLLDEQPKGLSPFVTLSEWTTPEQQRRCADVWASAIQSRVEPLDPRPPAADAPWTIGYLSNGFRQHPTACLTAEYFECHDRHRFRTVAYSTHPDDGSELRTRLQNAFAEFREVSGLPYAAVARQIRDDGVDVLVDLRGFGGGAVSEVLAMRPAPIQVNWLAYPGTMGQGFMDYIVVDPFVATPAVLESLGESAVILPHAYQPSDTTRDPTPHAVTRAECGLPEDGPVYCSFNNSYKFSPRVFDRWMQILDAVPGSVLWLLAGKAGTSTDTHLRAEAHRRGVDPDRLVFMAKLAHLPYLARYRLADLFLDTLPYNAHTTASDALWAGCPVLTCPGETFAGRVAGSLVSQLGLAGDLVAADLDDYRDRAIQLGRDPDALRSLRQRLTEARQTMPLFQTERLCRHMEQAFETMVNQCRCGERGGFQVNPTG